MTTLTLANSGPTASTRDSAARHCGKFRGGSLADTVLRADPPPESAHHELRLRREAANAAARTQHRVMLNVVLYTLTLPGGDPADDFAACQGQAAIDGLTVVDRITDVSTAPAPDASGGDNPALRGGYARLLNDLANPRVAVHGIVAVSRTSITTIDTLYRDQLKQLSRARCGLWLVREETRL